MKTKTCIKCQEVKPLDEYYKRKDSKDGHRNECKKCKLELSKEYRSENRDKISEYMKDYVSKPENKERAKSRHLRRNFGITLDDYNQMFTEQEGCCAICGKHQSELNKTLCVDHCHETGEVRELLCDKCNRGLGYFNDNADTMESAIEYLKKHEK